MAEVQRKVVTTTNKGLIFIIIIESVLLILFFLSGFNKLNPYLIVIALAAAAVFIWLYLRKPKVYDIYRILEEWRNSHYKKLNISLDTRDFQVVPVTPTMFYIHLPHEGLMSYFEGGKIIGIEANHIYRVLRRNEKSRLVLDSIKYLGTESKLRQAAEAIGADLGSLGLE